MIHVFVLFCCSLCLVDGVSVMEGDSMTVSVMEGDSVTLNTDSEILRGDEIEWRFGDKGTRIARIRRVISVLSTYDNGLKRFRDRLQLDHQTGSLTITNTSTEHTGLYKLSVMLGDKESSKIFNLTVHAPLLIPVITSDSPQCSSSSESSRCVLLCSVLIVTHTTLSWFKGNSLLSSISASNLITTLSLPLEVKYQDNNTYSCVANNPIRNQTEHFIIADLCQPCSDAFAETDEVITLSLFEGDSVTLQTTNAEIQRHDEIQWRFGAEGIIIAKLSREGRVVTYNDGPDGRFRDRLQLNRHSGELTIPQTRTTDTGLYTLKVISNETSHTRFRMFVSGKN